MGPARMDERPIDDEGEDDRRAWTDDRRPDEPEDDEVFAVCRANPVAQWRDRVRPREPFGYT